MEDTRDSSTQPQIVKIVRMVVKFHPLLTVTSLIFQVIFLQDWFEEEISNQWKVLKVYCQSIRRAVLDPITEKMENLSEALRIHLDKESTKGLLRAKLIGKLALFFATFLLLDTEVSSKYDKRGAKTQLLLLIGLDLLIRSKLWSQLGILRERCSCLANLTSNFTSFILALLFAKFYDSSLRSLSAVFCIAIFFLCLLVALRPRTDLGLFSFIIGVIGSITYNRFEFKFPTWIIASVCFVLFSFKSWLDKYWLDFEQDPSANATTGNTSVILILSSGAIRIARAIFSTSAVKSPLSDCKVWLVKAISCLLWSVRLHKFYPKDSSLPSSNMKQINCLILTIINVAQGLFAFALTLSPVANYKDWLFAIISYVVFCFWLGRCLPKDLLPPSTNAKGIKGMILSFQSIATYGIAVLAGLETRLYYRDWLVAVICYVLWWVWLHRSFPKDLLQSTTIEFKALQCWTVVVFTTVSDVISWIKLSRTTHHQQEG